MARYQLLRRLGAGGFGEVHLARDTGTGAAVAVKVLTDPTAHMRFVREAKMLLDEVGNDHVVRILDCNVEAPRPFLVLEYCDQGSLVSWVTERRPWPWVAVALAHVAAGLAPLHSQGGFHRDLKPGNLLVKLDPARGFLVKVADFGLARRPLTGPGGMTNTPGGTPGYMAPEVTCTPFDSRADVYSLGVVAVELLTGARDAERLGACAPPGLVALVRQMLATDPARRPTVEQIRAALTALVAREGPRIERAAVEPEGPTFMEALFGGLALGAAVLGAAALVFSSPSESRGKAGSAPS